MKDNILCNNMEILDLIEENNKRKKWFINSSKALRMIYATQKLPNWDRAVPRRAQDWYYKAQEELMDFFQSDKPLP